MVVDDDGSRTQPTDGNFIDGLAQEGGSVRLLTPVVRESAGAAHHRAYASPRSPTEDAPSILSLDLDQLRQPRFRGSIGSPAAAATAGGKSTGRYKGRQRAPSSNLSRSYSGLFSYRPLSEGAPLVRFGSRFAERRHPPDSEEQSSE